MAAQGMLVDGRDRDQGLDGCPDRIYFDGVLAGDDVLSRCRLHYRGSDDSWGFAVYLYSREAYEASVLLPGLSAGTPEEALDCACGLYLNDLNDPSAWV